MSKPLNARVMSEINQREKEKKIKEKNEFMQNIIIRGDNSAERGIFNDDT